MVFNASEIFEIAINIERNGQIFYRKAALITDNESIKELVESLATMEESHERYFIKLKNEFSSNYAGYMPDIDGQLEMYLKSYANGKIFDLQKPPEAFLNEKSSVEDILEVAIDFERNTVVFFTLIKELVPEGLDKEKIDVLIKEELKHVAMLCNQLTEYNLNKDEN
jgi:rubrerythrin